MSDDQKDQSEVNGQLNGSQPYQQKPITAAEIDFVLDGIVNQVCEFVMQSTGGRTLTAKSIIAEAGFRINLMHEDIMKKAMDLANRIQPKIIIPGQK